jgi:hypothetical protein
MLAQFLKDCCNQAEASSHFWQRPGLRAYPPEAVDHSGSETTVLQL